MEDYDEMVENLARTNSSDVIDNSSTNHAAVLIKNMFNSAVNSVDLFTGCLSKAVYEREDIKNAASAFISRGGQVRILVQDADADGKLQQHGLIDMLNSASKSSGSAGNFTINKLNSDVAATVKSHFLIMDKKGFRFESDKSKHEAVASFNNPAIASSLSELFNTLYKYSIKLKPQ